METNVVGTVNVLESARKSKNKPAVIYASTNKVYGSLENVVVGHGVTEDQPLDFHSPYGCSKGAADQYVRDYSRIYGLQTVVFRQSCVYGPRQFGVEDQGWLAHFAIQAINGKPITIFGDGNQVRDLLYIDDLIDAYLKAYKNIDKVSGQIFNIGGGVENAISLNKSIKLLKVLLNTKIILKYKEVRPGDQKVYISDNSKLKKHLGFVVKTGYSNGLPKLLTWLKEKDLQTN
jgi:CDP-paratose 2-epimerase